MVLSLAAVLVGCGSANLGAQGGSTNETSTNYEADFEKTANQLDTFVDNCECVASINCTVWSVSGPDNLAECLQGLLTAKKGEYIDGQVYLYHV